MIYIHVIGSCISYYFSHSVINTAGTKTSSKRKNCKAVIKAEFFSCLRFIFFQDFSSYRKPCYSIIYIISKIIKSFLNSKHNFIYTFSKNSCCYTRICILFMDYCRYSLFSSLPYNRSAYISSCTDNHIRLKVFYYLIGTRT